MTSGEQPVDVVDAVVQSAQRGVKIPKPGRKEAARLQRESMTARPPPPTMPPATPRAERVRHRDALNRTGAATERAAQAAREKLAQLMEEGRRLAVRLPRGCDISLSIGARSRRTTLVEDMERLFERACAVTVDLKQLVDQARRFRAAADTVTRQLAGMKVDDDAPPAPTRRSFPHGGLGNRREARDLERRDLELEAARWNVTPAPGESSAALRERIVNAAAAP